MKRTFLLLFLFFSFQIFSQTNIELDALFGKARELAFSGKRQEALVVCKQIIDANSSYWEAHVLMGRINAWDRKFNKSREIFKDVISQIQYVDAYDGLIDVEIWSGDFRQAIVVADSGLSYYPEHTSFLFKKARALFYLKEYEEAILVLNKLLAMENKNKEAQDLLAKIKPLSLKNKMGINNWTDVFSDIYKPRHLSSLEYQRNTKLGAFIPRINIANKFGKTGGQYEMDIYPKFGKQFSMYFNYGYSNSILFSKHRFGAELYKGIGKGYEVSLGFRDLILADESVMIYTGSLSKYYRNYLFSLRPYITPRTNSTETSLHFIAKKYLNDNLDNFMADVSAGSAPDSNQLFLSANQTGVVYFKSQQLSLSYNKTLKSLYEYKLGCSVQRMEVPFMPGDYIYVFGLDLGLKRKF